MERRPSCCLPGMVVQWSSWPRRNLTIAISPWYQKYVEKHMVTLWKRGSEIIHMERKGLQVAPWPLIGRRLHFSLQCILPSDILNHSCRTKRPECKWKLGMFQIQKDKKFGSLTPKRRVWAWGSILAIHKPVEMTLMEVSFQNLFRPRAKYFWFCILLYGAPLLLTEPENTWEANSERNTGVQWNGSGTAFQIE